MLEVILIIICLPLIYFAISWFFVGTGMLSNGIEKLAEKTKTDGCLFFIIFIVGAIFLVGTVIGSIKSCSFSSPSYDYYDAPRK